MITHVYEWPQPFFKKWKRNWESGTKNIQIIGMDFGMEKCAMQIIRGKRPIIEGKEQANQQRNITPEQK